MEECNKKEKELEYNLSALKITDDILKDATPWSDWKQYSTKSKYLNADNWGFLMAETTTSTIGAFGIAGFILAVVAIVVTTLG